GIAYHLLPFFGLTPKKVEPRWDRLVLILLHGGVVATWLSTVGAPWGWLGRVAPVLFAAALGLFLWETRALFASRPPEKMHPTVTYVRLAHLYLAVLAGVLLFSARGLGPPLVWAGVAGLGGWLTNAILGYLHRILPFYVWHNKYWGRGKEPGVPAFREMVAEGPAWIGLALHNAGVIGLLIALPTGLPLAGYLARLLVGAMVAAANLQETFLGCLGLPGRQAAAREEWGKGRLLGLGRLRGAGRLPAEEGDAPVPVLVLLGPVIEALRAQHLVQGPGLEGRDEHQCLVGAQPVDRL